MPDELDDGEPRSSSIESSADLLTLQLSASAAWLLFASSTCLALSLGSALSVSRIVADELALDSDDASEHCDDDEAADDDDDGDDTRRSATLVALDAATRQSLNLALRVSEVGLCDLRLACMA